MSALGNLWLGLNGNLSLLKGVSFVTNLHSQKDNDAFKLGNLEEALQQSNRDAWVR